jgi:signal peptidase
MNESGRRRSVKRLVRLSEATLALACLAGWWVTLRPAALGGPINYVVVRGDSMLPTYESGDLVLVHAAAGYAPGDVIAYRVPEGELGEGRLVIHRIVDGDGVSGFVVQGDNNPAPDPWRPPPSDIAGGAWLRIPALGRAVALLHQPATAGALAAAVVVWVLILRWQPRRHMPAA